MRNHSYPRTIVTLLLFIFLSISCSDDDSTIQNETASKTIIPVQNDETKIGQLTWATKNLNVSRYRNGDIIPEVTDMTQWANLTTGAWCYYDNISANGPVRGKLYNWYAVNDPRGLAPEGWHIPSIEEWTTVVTLQGGELAAGGSLKSPAGWQSPNVGATNTTGFSAIPGGTRNGGYFFYGLEMATFWTTSKSVTYPNSRWTAILYNNNTQVRRFQVNGMPTGCSVRCVKDYDVKDIDGNFYKGTSIGTQIWTTSNLNVSHYRNGDIIPQVTNATQWANLTTGAWCYYENNTANGPIYGKLYNWYAVNDPRGLAPEGWNVSTDAEWATMDAFLGGTWHTTPQIQSPNTTLWLGNSSLQVSNSTGFSAVPNGERRDDGFYMLHTLAEWWTSTESNNNEAMDRSFYSTSYVSNMTHNKRMGFAVRCVKN